MSESTTDVNDTAATTVDELRSLIREAEQALASGSNGDDIQDLRERLQDAIAEGQNIVSNLKDSVARQARRADELVRANPYQTAGIAAAVGLLVGFLVSRRGGSSD